MYQNETLKYPANHFIENHGKTLKQLIELFPLATLISTHQDAIYTSYLPFFWDTEGYLVGHLDANNPQVAFLNEAEKVRLIFNGPEAYISPAHFSTNELPTYNYCKIEVDGIVKNSSDEALKESIIQLTTHLEGKEAAYQLTSSENRLHHLIKYIHGFKVEIKQLQGRFKMSQDKHALHQEKAVKVMQISLKERSQLFLQNYWKHSKP